MTSVEQMEAIQSVLKEVIESKVVDIPDSDLTIFINMMEELMIDCWHDFKKVRNEHKSIFGELVFRKALENTAPDYFIKSPANRAKFAIKRKAVA